MQLRRPLVNAAAVTLMAGLLSACGQSYNTNRENNNMAGTFDQSGTVDVVAATIVSDGPDAGTFIANLSNNNRLEAATLVSFAGVEDDTVEAAEFEPLEVPPGGYVNLADGLGIPVTGEFSPGDVVSMQFEFEGADPVQLGVPVMLECEEYAGLDPAVPGEEPEELSPEDEATYSCEAPSGVEEE